MLSLSASQFMLVSEASSQPYQHMIFIYVTSLSFCIARSHSKMISFRAGHTNESEFFVLFILHSLLV
jgi:hypothetical protein